MSLLSKYLKGWTFRTNRPVFEEGAEITAFITGYENGSAVARIGDTILTVPNAPQEAVGSRVRLEVESFDGNDHEGRATFVEIVGGGSF